MNSLYQTEPAKFSILPCREFYCLYFTIGTLHTNWEKLILSLEQIRAMHFHLIWEKYTPTTSLSGEPA
jgi:hypothetical protein